MILDILLIVFLIAPMVLFAIFLVVGFILSNRKPVQKPELLDKVETLVDVSSEHSLSITTEGASTTARLILDDETIEFCMCTNSKRWYSFEIVNGNDTVVYQIVNYNGLDWEHIETIKFILSKYNIPLSLNGVTEYQSYLEEFEDDDDDDFEEYDDDDEDDDENKWGDPEAWKNN